MPEEGREDRLQKLPGYIVLIQKPNDLDLYGPIENSFSLDVAKNRTQFFWTSANATSNLGGKFEIDGLKNADDSVAYWKGKYPEWTFGIYDARDEETLPVSINWELWLDANQYSDKTFAGVKNKHEARNLRFLPKGTEHKIKTAPALTMQITTTDLR